MNEKEKGFSKITVIILIAILVLIITAIVVIVRIKSNKGISPNGTNSIKSSYINGKIPYNKDINKTTKNYITYKDNTRNMEKQNDTYLIKSGSIKMTKTIDFINFSFYLKSNEQDVLSYKWDNTRGFGYEFNEMELDDSGENYIYSFASLDDNAIILITSINTEKSKLLNMTNAEESNLNDRIIYKGIYADKYNAFKYVEDNNGLKYSLIYITTESNVENVLNKIDEFNMCLSNDSGAPFIVDYMITNNTIAYRHVKSYKFVTGIVTMGKVAGLVGGKNLDLDYDYILNNNYIYEGTSPTRTAILDNKLDDYSKVVGEVYKTQLYYSYDVKKSEMSLIANQNSNYDIDGYNTYIIRNYDSAKEFEKYTSSFIEMLVLNDYSN